MAKRSSNDFSGSPEIRISKGTYYSSVLKSMSGFIGIIIISLIVLYVVFAATLIRVVPTTTAGFIPSKNMTFSGGIAPAGSELLVSMGSDQGKDFGSRLKQSFLPMNDAAIVKVVAGPYGKLTWAEPDRVTIDGKLVEAKLKPVDKKSPLDNRDPYLKDEYLAVCIKGDCVVGDAVIVSKNKIVGVPLKNYSK